MALESLARICGPSQASLPTIEFPRKYEKSLRGIATLQDENTALGQQIKDNEKKIMAHSVRIAELMKAHEHGVLTTTKDKLLTTKTLLFPQKPYILERKYVRDDSFMP